MSPETISHKVPVLEESARIRDELMLIEAEEREIYIERKAQRTAAIRDRLNYRHAEDVDISKLVDTRIESKDIVIAPEDLSDALPISRQSYETTLASREAAADIIQHKDGRLIVILGPCSIHDPEEALQYAEQVKVWRQEFGKELELIMRFYPEKPRTEKDWKGFIYDPLLNGTDDMNLGVVATRMLACRITDSGVPLAMERLNANTPQFLNGLVAYDAIGARNASDQKAREYLSGTSSVGGIKNPQDGNVLIATQGVASANQPHAFLGMDESGLLAQVRTKGNETSHIILRGSDSGPNYDRENIEIAKGILRTRGLLESIVIDASHGNSGKKAERQFEVVLDVAEQIRLGETAIKGVMIEGNIHNGAQKLKDKEGRFKPKSELKPGVSVTDECVGIDKAYGMLSALAAAVKVRLTRPESAAV